VDGLMNQYRARGLAVIGLHETLEALAVPPSASGISGATVTFIGDPALLKSTGGVGAFLR